MDKKNHKLTYKKRESIRPILRNSDIKNCDKIRSELPANFCPMPFSTLIVNPDGRVGFCRERTNDDIVGNIKEQTLEEIWNGEKIRKVRREFLEGKVHACSSQIKDRRCNEQCFNQVILPQVQISEYQDGPPNRLSPDFNGKCNLQCIMCTIWKLPNGLYDEIGFWEHAEKNVFPYLQMIDPLAGEPFVQKDFYRLIDIMARVNPDCVWRVTTNLHWEFNDHIKRTLDKLKNIYSLICSIDAFSSETYYKIRYPGKLSLVHDTLDKLIEYRRQRIIEKGPEQRFGISVAFAFQKDNWHEVPDFMRWGHALGVEPAIQGVYFPEELSVFKIASLDKRKEILNFLIEEMDFRDLIHIFRITTPLAASMPADDELFYKLKIINSYFSKSLPVEAMQECSESIPRFLESFEEPLKEEITIKILDFSLKMLTWEQIQAAGGFWPKIIKLLNPELNKIYTQKFIIHAKKNATYFLMDALTQVTQSEAAHT